VPIALVIAAIAAILVGLFVRRSRYRANSDRR